MTRAKCWMATGLLCGAFAGSLAADNGSPLLFSVEVGALATDNRDSAPSNEESNVDIRVIPRIGLRLDNERTLLDLLYAPFYRWRSDPSPVQNENEFFHELGLEFSHELSSLLELNVRDSFSLNDDPAITAGSSTLRQDGTYWMNRLTAVLAVNFSSRVYVDLEGFHRIKRYEEDVVAQNLDEEATTAGATLWYQLNPKTAALATVLAGTYEYDNTSFDRGFDSLYGGVGLYRVLGNGMRVDARVGVVTLMYNDDTLEDDTLPAFDVSLRPAPTAPTRYTLSGGFSLRDADLAPFASQEYTYVHAKVERDATVRLIVSGEVRWSEGDYSVLPAPAAAAGFRAGTEEQLLLAGGLKFKVNDKNEVTLRHDFVTTDSDAGVTVDRNFDRNTTWLGWRVTL